MLGAALQAGAIDAAALPGLMADGANLHKVPASHWSFLQNQTGSWGVCLTRSRSDKSQSDQ